MNKESYVIQNPEYIDALYQQYLNNPKELPESWRYFFEGFTYGADKSESIDDLQGDLTVSKEVKVAKLIEAYQLRGHLLAKTNPVRERRIHVANLSLNAFGFSESELNDKFEAGQQFGIKEKTLKGILEHLQTTYCGNIGVEFMHIKRDEVRTWLAEKMHKSENKPHYSSEKQKDILDKLSKAVGFESFLHTKYVGKKRFSLEGCEALIPALNILVEEGAHLGAQEFVIGMAHRGRLNVLTNVFCKKPLEVFSEFEETLPDNLEGWNGDVKYHMGRSSNITVADKQVHLSLIANPSHLEAVNPVVQGVVYGKLQQKYDQDSKKIVPVLIHGDAAFSGQGVNYELVNMANLDGYGVGGTVHIVLNNQIGFTANYLEGRSSVYCTDIAKVLDSPIFHVNADCPEAVSYCIELAIEMRQKFGIDVYVDILGYRRYGHNEGDEPRFTQPKLYESIDKHDTVYDIYRKKLIDAAVIKEGDALALMKAYKETLQQQLDKAKNEAKHFALEAFTGSWEGLRAPAAEDFKESISTKIQLKALQSVCEKLSTYPDSFTPFSKLGRVLKQRKTLMENKLLDWGMAEQLAYGSLMLEGHDVRISGQDCCRGTFSHRHAVTKDNKTEEPFCFLNQLDTDAKLTVYNSHLSEYAVLGFEYGFSMACPQKLSIWEAQFGDFANGAQIVIDQFIASAQTKWNRYSGLTLLLPHGYEGQGPEHSSARLERFLQLCADNNMYVANVTSPANFFHLLRRQVKNKYRTPLVVMSPKSLLRHPKVQSSFKEFTTGKFQEVIFDDTVKSPKKVLLCTGKVYYDLLDFRDKNAIEDVAIIRVEQLYPLNTNALSKFKKQSSAKQWLWVQEEPKNMGAWMHVAAHLEDLNLKYVGRAASSSTAVGNSKVHAIQQQRLIEDAFTN